MNTKHAWFAALLSAIVPISLAQSANPPAQPEGGKSLDATLRLIQEELSSIHATHFVAHTHDESSGADGTNQLTEEISQVRVDPLTCLVGLHEKEIRDAQVLADFDAQIPLKELANVLVLPAEQFIREENIKHDRASISTRIEPPIFVLKTIKVDGRFNDLRFADQDLAKRVAAALLHAAQLCGGHVPAS